MRCGGRPPLSDEEFGNRFYDPSLAPVASRLCRLLAENLECDLAGLIPTDDFERWLARSSDPDSAADTFFEEVAIEFRLTRWPDGFGSFDALVRFVAEPAPASRPPGHPEVVGAKDHPVGAPGLQGLRARGRRPGALTRRPPDATDHLGMQAGRKPSFAVLNRAPEHSVPKNPPRIMEPPDHPRRLALQAGGTVHS